MIATITQRIFCWGEPTNPPPYIRLPRLLSHGTIGGFPQRCCCPNPLHSLRSRLYSRRVTPYDFPLSREGHRPRPRVGPPLYGRIPCPDKTATRRHLFCIYLRDRRHLKAWLARRFVVQKFGTSFVKIVFTTFTDAAVQLFMAMI